MSSKPQKPRAWGGTAPAPAAPWATRRYSSAANRAWLRRHGGIKAVKQFRAVATRYDKRERIYQGTVDVASIRIRLPDPVP